MSYIYHLVASAKPLVLGDEVARGARRYLPVGGTVSEPLVQRELPSLRRVARKPERERQPIANELPPGMRMCMCSDVQ